MSAFFRRQESGEEKGRFDNAFSRSRSRFREGLMKLIGRQVRIDAGLLDEIEAFLYESDLGTAVTEKLLNRIEKESRGRDIGTVEEIGGIILDEFRKLFRDDRHDLAVEGLKPAVILVAGVNGAGKTTSIGKLADYYRRQGKKVLIVAGDTYRAAAVEQLEAWAERSGCDIVMDTAAKNPSGLIYDGIRRGIEKSYDIVIVDTAGRLHTQANLMEELEKIVKVIRKLIPEAPHESLLVLDGTVGQNGLVQARQFSAHIPITGLIISKLDGTAKGGIVIAVKEDLGIPVKFVGLGETIKDLVPFDPELYVNALFRDFSEK